MVSFPAPPTKNPATIAELFDFYHSYLKFYYGYVQAQNELPAETLFELNSALDHLSRHWISGEPEEAVVDKCYSHLKRCCLDVFKILAMDAHDQFRELRRIDTSVIDNGEFDRDLIRLHHRIKSGAREARRLEGVYQRQGDEGGLDRCFELWQPVVADCQRLEEDFYLNLNVDWAKKRTSAMSIRLFAAGVMASLVAGLILTPDVSTIFGPNAKLLCRATAALALLLLAWPGPAALAYWFARDRISDYLYLRREDRLSLRRRALNRGEAIIEGGEVGAEPTTAQEDAAVHSGSGTGRRDRDDV